MVARDPPAALARGSSRAFAARGAVMARGLRPSRAVCASVARSTPGAAWSAPGAAPAACAVRLGPDAAWSAPGAALLPARGVPAARPLPCSRRGSFATRQCGLARASARAVHAASSTDVVPIINIIIYLI
jgi:hypothetical protein